MTASAHDIARELRKRLPGIDDQKLHALLYYCQGHHLAAFGVPLFSEEIVAAEPGFWERETMRGVSHRTTVSSGEDRTLPLP